MPIMSNVIDLFAVRQHRARGDAEPGFERLTAIRDILSVVDLSNVRSSKDMLRALWMLDIANTNIRIALAHFRGVPDQEQLVRQSKKLADMIEFVRERLSGPGTGAGAEPGVKSGLLRGNDNPAWGSIDH
jgi:hypothetical protein